MNCSRRHRRLSLLAVASAVLAGTSSVRAQVATLTKGQQWFVDNGLQIMGLIGDPANGNPFHLSTFQSMGYTSELWEWNTDPSQLTMSWGRWVSGPSNMPPQGLESAHMGNLKQLGISDEEDLNNSSIRDQWVAWYNSAHANPTFNGVLLWNNNWGGQISDSALGDFISRAKPDMISFDTYPYPPGSQPAGGSPTNWYGSFRQYRQWGLSTNTPIGFYRQTYASPTGSPPTRAVSDSELRLETFAGLAFNAKSIEDFTYNFNGTTLFSGGSGDNTLTALGVAAQTMNAQAKRLGPALVRLKPVADTVGDHTTSIMFIRGKNTDSSTYNPVPNSFVVDPQSSAYTDWTFGANDPYLSGFSVANVGTKNLGLPGDAILSWFNVLDESYDGAYTNEKYLMVVNGLADMNGTGAETRQTIDLDFLFGSTGITQLQHINQSTGAVEDVNLTNVGGKLRYELTLDGGAGDLFKFKDGAPFVGLQAAGAIFWDNDASAGNNNVTTGAGLGGSGTWDTTSKWYNGSGDAAWTSGGEAVFWGAAGTVTLSAPQTAGTLTFKTDGYTVAGSTLTIANSFISVDSGVTATIASVIAGNVGITKGGSGTLNLTGVNTYTGTTSIDGGVLGISASSLGAVPGSPIVNIEMSNGGTLRFNGAGTTLSVNRQVYLATGGGVIDTNGNSATVAGVISGSSLTKAGAGTLVLSNTNTYTGGTTITGGTLQITSDANLGTPPGSATQNIYLDSATLLLNNTSPMQLNSHRSIAIGPNGATLMTNLTGTGSDTWAGALSGPSSAILTKSGAGSVFLAANSLGYQGKWVITGGEINPANATTADNGWGAVPDHFISDYLTLNNSGSSLAGIRIGAGGSYTMNANRGIKLGAGGGTIDTVSTNANITLAGVISGTGPLSIMSVAATFGMVTLSGANTYSGPTSVTAGTLALKNTSALGSSALTIANATLQTGIPMSFSNPVSISGTATIDTAGNNATYAGSISTSGNLVKTSAGTFALNSLRAGALTVSAGTLAIASGGGNAGTSRLSLLSVGSGLLDLNDHSLIVDYTASTPAASIRQMLVSGYGTGDWGGTTGVTSSLAHADTSLHHTLAYGDAAAMGITNFAGQTITGNAVIVKYTYPGDSNLDGIVDLDNDFSLFVDGYNKQISNPSSLNAGNLWVNGDYNYDGVIDLDNDFSIFVNSYASYTQDPTQLAQLDSIINSMDLTTAQKNALLSAVPEPGTLSLAIAGVPLLLRRKRKSR